jgi:hypothetical protein
MELMISRIGTNLGSFIYLIIANNYTLRLNLLNLNVSFQSSVFSPNGGNTILIWMVSICFELVIWWFEFKCMAIVQHMEVLCKVGDHFILLNPKLERHCDVRSKQQKSRTIMCQTNCLKYQNWSSWGFLKKIFLLTTHHTKVWGVTLLLSDGLLWSHDHVCAC